MSTAGLQAARVDAAEILPGSPQDATLVGRLWQPGRGPRLVAVAGTQLVDVTPLGPTMSDLLERPDPADAVRAAIARRSGPSWSLSEVLAATVAEADRRRGTDDAELAEPVLLSPVDLQVLKAAGVTFVASMIERVIEEKIGGDAARAAEVREQIAASVGTSIADLQAGSDEALSVLEILRDHGLWSQYLQVGLGPHPEVFTKAPCLSSVGHGSDIGIASVSTWNNPEPELALVIDSGGTPKGATLGNDANLRDIEGASALLLPLAKDNNASAALGPFIRLFDAAFTLADAEATTVTLRIEGTDGFALEATAPQSEIARPMRALVEHTINRRHQYPDGLVLYCGTPFAPTEDRDAPGMGFTHHDGDLVAISSPALGTLINRVTPSERAPAWRYGIRDLFRSLTGEGYLD
ncbi:MAG TPA: fumarylacetoacetate hydrolase family protein [Solirubrobacter sp.]|nr:fumarylacetoacetate hydrolase family protein [Solirubrobacter sp.]